MSEWAEVGLCATRERERSWYCVSTLQKMSIGSLSDNSVLIHMDIFDNTTLHLVCYFRCFFKRLQLKNVHIIHKFNPPNWLVGVTVLSHHWNPPAFGMVSMSSPVFILYFASSAIRGNDPSWYKLGVRNDY